jgi:hypothetical protein
MNLFWKGRFYGSKQGRDYLEREICIVDARISPTPVANMEKLTVKEQAEYAAYRDPNTHGLYIPGVAIQRALVSAAAFSKGKARSSLVKHAAACFLVTPERIPLKKNEYIIDSRPVVIPATKGCILRHRPRLDEWEIEFTLEWDPALLDETQVRKIVDDMGSRVGLLDFRPEKKGPFGRSTVIRWEAA